MATKPQRRSSKSARTAKAAKAVQRAIRKDNPANEPPTVGKPVIVDPADQTRTSKARAEK